MKIYSKIIVLLAVVATSLFLCSCAADKANNTSMKINKEPIVGAAEEPVPGPIKVSEFILGQGDTISISVYRHDDLSKTMKINMSGKIMYPLIGDVQAAGVDLFQLRDTIRDRLAKYIVDPQVVIDITSIQSHKVTVLGEVQSPGVFNIDSSLTTLEAVSKAGGFTLDAKQKNVLLVRGGLKNPTLMSLNLKDALFGSQLAQNVYIQPGDIIYVPRTFIANVDRFFQHLANIISPIVSIESGYYIGQQIERGTTHVSVPAQ